MTYNYQSPVADLLQYGKCSYSNDWSVQTFKFQESHIPELWHMVTDPELNQADSNSLEVWAPVHAWQTLGQLGAASVSGALLNLLDDPENDWSHSEIPIVLGMMGAATLPDIQQYLADQTRDPFGRISAPTSLAEVGTRHPEARDQCLDLLAQQLAKKRTIVSLMDF